MEDHHAGRLEKDALVGVTVVVGVLVLFGVGEHVSSSRPADTGQHRVLEEQTTLGLVVQDLTVAEVTQDTLVLLSVEVAVQNGHYSQSSWSFALGTGVEPGQRQALKATLAPTQG